MQNKKKNGTKEAKRCLLWVIIPAGCTHCAESTRAPLLLRRQKQQNPQDLQTCNGKQRPAEKDRKMTENETKGENGGAKERGGREPSRPVFRAVGEVGRLAPAHPPPAKECYGLRQLAHKRHNLRSVSANCRRLITASQHVHDSTAAAAHQHVYITTSSSLFL